MIGLEEKVSISFKFPVTTNVKLELFNIRGQLIEKILSKTLNSGSHQVQITAGDLASGIYILKLQAGEQTRLRRILLIK
ncbi:MAG: T9SS type A sorting domain-containing protein [Caldisericaceae bacterium]|nr:T9SS type A sorting domain-containing protein [Caldisericaceae bacterium]